MSYGSLMWGANVTASTRGLRVTRGAATLDATLSITPTTFPDYIPAGNGVAAYDLLKNLKDALDAAEDATGDPAITYSVACQSDSVTGMTGKITITNDQGQDFDLLLAHANTTIDRSWFGMSQATSLMDDTPSYGVMSSTSGVLTSPHTSSLWWAPQKQFAFHLYHAGGDAMVYQTRSLDKSTIVTRRISKRHEVGTYTTTQMTDYASIGGRASFSVDRVEEKYVWPVPSSVSTDLNRSLLMWWSEHASAGKWFLVLEDNAAPGFTTSTRYHLARLEQEQCRDFRSMITRHPEPSPQLWRIEVPYMIVASGEINAGGA